MHRIQLVREKIDLVEMLIKKALKKLRAGVTPTFTVRARGRGHAATFTTSISGAVNPSAERRRIPSLVVR